MFIVEEKKD